MNDGFAGHTIRVSIYKFCVHICVSTVHRTVPLFPLGIFEQSAFRRALIHSKPIFREWPCIFILQQENARGAIIMTNSLGFHSPSTC